MKNKYHKFGEGKPSIIMTDKLTIPNWVANKAKVLGAIPTFKRTGRDIYQLELFSTNYVARMSVSIETYKYKNSCTELWRSVFDEYTSLTENYPKDQS